MLRLQFRSGRGGSSQKVNPPPLSHTISSIEAGETRNTFSKHWCLEKCVTLGSLMLLKSLSAGSLLVLTSRFFLLLTVMIRGIAWVQAQCFQDPNEQHMQTRSAQPWNRLLCFYRDATKMVQKQELPAFLRDRPPAPSTWLYLHHTCTLHS